MLSAVLFVIAAYVMGSIPTGYWTVKAVKGVDIRDYGSKSTGATNVWRCFGKGMGIFVFVADVLKGWVPTALAHHLSQGALAAQWSFAPDVVPALVALAALVGHGKSIFLKGQGGKSAATGLGTLAGLCPPGAALTFLTWAVLTAVFRYVSLASVLGVLMCGVYFKMFNAPIPYVIYCVAGFLWVTWRHRSNLKRLMNGTEPKVGDKPKDAPEQNQNGDKSTETAEPASPPQS